MEPKPKPLGALDGGRLIKTSEHPFIPSYRTEDFLDPQAFQREFTRIGRTSEERFRAIARYLPPYSSSDKEGKRWETLQNKILMGHSMLQITGEEIEEVESGKPITFFGLYVHHALQVGASLLMYDALEELKGISRRNVESETVRNMLDSYFTSEQCMMAAEVVMRVGRFAIQDLFDKQRPVSTPDLYEALILAQLFRPRKQHGGMLAFNEDLPVGEYPNFFMNRVDRAGLQMTVLSALPSEEIDRIANVPLSYMKEIGQWLKRASGRMHELQERVKQVILNPTDAEFSPLREAVEKYMVSESREERMVATHVLLGQSKPSQIRAFYRQAQAQVREDTELYSLLIGVIKEYIQEVPVIMGILTSDDVPTILDADAFRIQTTPSLEELWGLIRPLTMKARLGEYTVNPKAVAWGGLITPQRVYVKFHPNKPRVFGMSFAYKSETGEVLDLELNIDTGKNTFEWSFVESPRDPEMETIYRSSMLAAKSVLVNVAAQVEEGYQAKQNTHAVAQPTVSTPTIKREKVEREPVQKEEKPVESKRPQVSTPIAMTLLEGLSGEEQGVNKQVVFEETKDLSDYTSKLSATDQEKVAKAIEQFNARGVGRFYPLKQSDREGNPIYVLRVGSTDVRAGIRVLLREGESTNEQRTFIVRRIGYRKDIYREEGV